jgi:NADPH:quinone reductase-like Zn-dependent oxidoreductase
MGAAVKAVRIQTFGDPDGMEVVDAPEPVVGPGRLLIETEAIGVGGVDAVIRRGTLGSAVSRDGMIPGSEVAGRVIAVGDAVDPIWVGRRAWAFTGVGGGYVERATAGVDDVTPLPDGLSAIDAVTLGSAGPVAHFALAHARFSVGDSVLIRGAAGSIGIMAVQLAAAGGASEIAVTTSSLERGRRLRTLGATRVLDRSGETGEPGEPGEPGSDRYDVVVDIVGGAAVPSFIDRLAPNGRMVSVGVVGGYPPSDFGMSLMRAFQRSLSFATFSLDTVPIPERNLIRAEQFEAAARGDLQSIVHDVMPLDRAADAHRRMDAGEVFGRIVLTP